MAVAFVYFGAGAENILVAFQITFVGSLVFGLTQLLLADHDGPIDRRDWLGLLAGFAGLLCSGVAITMTVVVGLAVLLRRGRAGWRVALFHTAPLGAAYLLWSVLAPKGQNAGNYRSHSPVQVLKFVLIGIQAAFGRMGQVPGVGVLLGVVLVAGLVVLVRGHRGEGEWLGRIAIPIALLAGGLVFLLFTGIVRSGQGGLTFLANGTGPDRARDSRYVYLIAAMALPATALGAEALIRQWRRLAIPVAAVLLIGVPGNIHQLMNPKQYFANAQFTRSKVLYVPDLPYASQLRGSHVLIPDQRLAAEGLTLGWLVDNADKLPKPGFLFPVTRSTFAIQLLLVPTHVQPSVRCEPVPRSAIHVLAKGQRLTFEGGNVSVAYLPVGGTRSLPQVVKPSTVVALVGPLRIIVKPIDAGARICE